MFSEKNTVNTASFAERAISITKFTILVFLCVLFTSCAQLGIDHDMIVEDIYEPNNTMEQATLLPVNFQQQHSFTKIDETDYFYFNVTNTNSLYRITISETDKNIDHVSINIWLYSGNINITSFTNSATSGATCDIYPITTGINYFRLQAGIINESDFWSYSIFMQTFDNAYSQDQYEYDNGIVSNTNIIDMQTLTNTTQYHTIHLPYDFDYIILTNLALNRYYRVLVSVTNSINMLYSSIQQKKDVYYIKNTENYDMPNESHKYLLASNSPDAFCSLVISTSSYFNYNSYPYTVVVSMVSNGDMTNDIHEPDNGPVSAPISSTLNPGEGMWHTLNPANDVDFIKLNITNTNAIITVTNVIWENMINTLYCYLYAPDGGDIIYAFSVSTSNSLEYTFDETNVYFLKVRSSHSFPGRYWIELH